MAQSIKIEAKGIKNIARCEIELDFEKGIYALVGSNGCGKSTLMNMLAVLVRPSALRALASTDYAGDSYVKIQIDECIDTLVLEQGSWTTQEKHNGRSHMKNHYRGFFEGSIFYGTRFYDYAKIQEIGSTIQMNDLRPVDDFVKQSLSKILHDDYNHYTTLVKIKSKERARVLGLEGVPYFFLKNDQIISQYNMSSGECMLISLIDFVNNLISRNRAPRGTKVIFLIDEVELALHPSAIDRLLDFFKYQIKTSEYEVVVYFSTHSSEVIQKISPNKTYLLENINGIIECTNPCYANYAIRNLYVPNGFDFLILVEDVLAKELVWKCIRDNNICESRLICILPGGGWSQLLKLHMDMITNNILGVGKKIISIYDGDVEDEVAQKTDYQHLPKCFLPINSIEKYLKKKLCIEVDRRFAKLIGDKYFTQRPLSNILQCYASVGLMETDKSGKKLYKDIISSLKIIGIEEEQFIKMLCEDISIYESDALGRFTQIIKRLIQ
ncbi:MAG: AAA family ATPase [Erysipelotrichales bacterium]|nr:AAA family ATPase [Erysipelotrichales bacterium]